MYARGGAAWVLGFAMLVPWLLSLDDMRTLRASFASGIALSGLFVVAVFAWFGDAVASYTGIGSAGGVLLLAFAAPLLQPQVIAYALARQLAGRRFGPALRALAAAAAWVGCEWLWPKLLGDTIGHGLQPSAWLRQAADLGGAPLLSLLLLLANEALALAWRRRRDGLRALRAPLAVAVAIPLALACYGSWRVAQLQAMPSEPALRVAMVQANIVDYERLRRERGAYAVVREVLDTHFAMSEQAARAGGIDALLWSETVYPTTYGKPKSEAGGELDAEISGFVRAVGLPLVFGTYDRDDAGEYNAAAFIAPADGLLGFYRKTHPFPLTEHVPAWLDGPRLRRWLPWAGTWQPGNGARVFPLRLADGREIPVLPLICLDDVHPDIAREGMRQGAQVLLGMSNDSWFSAHPQGARLHLAVASFRSIETRLPQLRVTANGISAVVDASGQAVAKTAMGERVLLVGKVPARTPPTTLAVAWGDWIGPVCLCGLLLLLLAAVVPRATAPAADLDAAGDGDAWPMPAVRWPTAWRWFAVVLRLLSWAALAWLACGWLLGDAQASNPLARIRMFAALVLLPEAALWVLRRVFAVRLVADAERMTIERRGGGIDIARAAIADVQAWRLPLPGTGVHLLSRGAAPVSLQLRDPALVRRALMPGDAAAPAPRAWPAFVHARASTRRPWLDRPCAKFLLFPLLPAGIAFRLHQHIAYGGTFGEYQTFGLKAWLSGFVLWWADWAIAMVLFAAVLRVAVEALALLAAGLRPASAQPERDALEWIARLAFWLGAPAWLVLRLLA